MAEAMEIFFFFTSFCWKLNQFIDLIKPKQNNFSHNFKLASYDFVWVSEVFLEPVIMLMLIIRMSMTEIICPKAKDFHPYSKASTWYEALKVKCVINFFFLFFGCKWSVLLDTTLENVGSYTIFCFNNNVFGFLQQYMAHLLSLGQLDGSGWWD